MYEQNPVIHTINYGDTIYNLAKLYNTTADAILNSNPYVNPYNLIVGQILTIFPNSMNNANSKKETTLSNNMRMFWEQHVF